MMLELEFDLFDSIYDPNDLKKQALKNEISALKDTIERLTESLHDSSGF